MSEETITENPTDLNPIGHMLDDYVAWVNDQGEGEVKVEYDEDDDSFRVIRNEADPVTIYSSEIDEQFYLEGQAVFVEAEVGTPNETLNLADVMRFSGDELVLSRISLTERDEGEFMLVVEAALPTSMVEFGLLDLMVREVATIASDIRSQLPIGEAEDADDDEGDDENDDDDGDDDDYEDIGDD
ncbi:MAG: hypothetical protein KC910_00130 [Candidatus Eremiobacteraeota bacterium]|nr:hypothetical protein [Candidatus Eremiobacteraeota bacterium]